MGDPNKDDDKSSGLEVATKPSGLEDPGKEDVDEFIKANDVDDRAAVDLRECPASVQRAVLARGDLSTARNPSAALLLRIRDARVGGSIGSSGTTVGLPSSADIENFIKRNDIDRRTGDSLRSSSPTIKRAVLAGGDVTAAPNPSHALAARLANSKRGGATSAMLSARMALPSSADIEEFLSNNEVDKNCADQLRNSSAIVQRAVLSRGDLRNARNPSAALLARIRDARASMPEGMVPGMVPPSWAQAAQMGFPPPGGQPMQPPGEGSAGSSSGYPPPGYPAMYPGYYPGYFPGYPPGMYGGYPGYPGYPPPGAPGAGPADPNAGRGGSPSSYSYSYSISRSRSRSPSVRKPRGGQGRDRDRDRGSGRDRGGGQDRGGGRDRGRGRR